MNPLRIGTRGSPLALWQANHVAGLLRPLIAPREVLLVRIETSGDVNRSVSLPQIGGEGLFTKEIQRALLDNTVDVAVHSLKDLPTIVVEELTLAAVPQRGPTGDALVSLKHRNFDALPQGAVVASSSLRRRAQLLHRRPDLTLIDIRGNVETRLRKLEEQNLDATILAEAGLKRLGLADRITELLDPSWMLPAVGQGALGLECRTDDDETRRILEQLNDMATRQAVLAERAFLRAMGGGCQVPMGAFGVLLDGVLHLRAAVLSPDGRQRVEMDDSSLSADAEVLGQRVAHQLLARGADKLLEFRQ
jgi:hydroxymethylbilane synthase